MARLPRIWCGTMTTTMNQIIFATSNTGKVATLKRHLEVNGLDMTVVPQVLELIEPQAHTAREVALAKATQAYQQLGQPVLVDDSSFHIEALGGFPGPYVKYMIDSIGATGIMKFMEGQTNRRAYFSSALVFVDESGESRVFEDKTEGEIAEIIDPNDHKEAWSELWKIFSPAGKNGKTLSQFDMAELKTFRKGQSTSAYAQLARWLKTSPLLQ